MYANPQMCRLVGYSQEEILLADRLELVLTTRTKFSFQRTLLGVWYANPAHSTRIGADVESREKMGVSDVRQSVLELLGQSGDLIKVQAGAQFFYGPNGHVRTSHTSFTNKQNGNAMAKCTRHATAPLHGALCGTRVGSHPPALDFRRRPDRRGGAPAEVGAVQRGHTPERGARVEMGRSQLQ